MTTFALDTATPSPALAVVADGDVIAELVLEPSPAGGRRVLECVHELLIGAGMELGAVQRIVVGVGPGGFTGLRIGVATAMGLAQALGVPVVGASSLEALALGLAGPVTEDVLVAPVIDARRREVFGALYRVRPGGAVEELVPPAAAEPHDLSSAILRAAQGEAVQVGGDGLSAAGAAFERPTLVPLPPDSPAHRVHAACLVRRVDAGGQLPVVPLYLRLPDAEVNRLRAGDVATERPAA